MREQGISDPEQTKKSKEIDFANLALQIKEGSKEAEKTLYEFIKLRWELHIKNQLRKNGELLNDVINESFTKILTNIKNGQLNRPESFERYCNSVVLNTTNEFLRNIISERRRNLPSSTFEGYNFLEELLNSNANIGNENANDPETELLNRERLQIAEELINSLRKERYRQILKMFYLEGKTKEEICDELGISEVEFKNRKHRALQQIKYI
jgi:RNA polymerase sigma-70 factor (ECF subfamily)